MLLFSFSVDFISETDSGSRDLLKMSDSIEAEFAMVVNSKQSTSTIINSIMSQTYFKNSTKLSVYTLTTILGCIYGLAFVLAISWVVWLWMRRRSSYADSGLYSRCCS